MATIDHIASRAQLSRSSVAKILRGERGFNEGTRRRVLRIAEKLNYQPSYLGKALAGGKSMTIGVVVSSLRVPITMEKIDTIDAAAAQAGYVSYLVRSDANNLESIALRVRELLRRRVDGLLVHLTVPIDTDLQKQLLASPRPVVLMDFVPPIYPWRVAGLREAASRDAVDHLHALGHRRVGLFHTTSDVATPQLKVATLREACLARGMRIEHDDRYLLPAGDCASAVYEQVRQVCGRPAERRPTALLMNNDEGAAAAIAAVQDAGLRVPRDMSVVGFDDLPALGYLRPSLTTIHQPRGELGQAAFAMLLALMQDRSAKPDPVELACRLIIRQSSGPAPR